MHCAKCKAYTEKTELLNVEVDVCPECRGIWFDRNELSTIVGTKQDLQVRPGEMKPTSYSCPRCAHPLMEASTTWDRTLLVDICAGCEGIFLDAEELEKATDAAQELEAKLPPKKIQKVKKRNRRREALSRIYREDTPASKAPLQNRVGFLKKVYGLLTATLVSTIAGVWIGIEIEAWRYWIVTLILSFALLFGALGARTVPVLNLVLLFSYTFVEGLFLCGIIASYFEAGAADLVAQAFVITLGIFGALTTYIFVTKKDLSGLGPYLYGFLIALILAGILLIFTATPLFEIAWSFLGAILFCGFILYDTSRILLKYNTDEYISAVISLYLDFINLFLDILRILGATRR